MFTGRVKSHRCGITEILCASKAVFRQPGWEERGKKQRLPCPQSQDTEWQELSVWDLERIEQEEQRKAADSLCRSMRRARTNVRDYAFNTPMRWFVTLTLDKATVDRYDGEAVVKKLSTWLDNQVRRRGLAYVLVPERHKDGAIHFHGLINDAVDVVDSGTVVPPGGGKPRRPRSRRQRDEWIAQGGHVVYNLPGWRFGFTTAMELYGDYAAAVGYVCKYIGKDPQKVGGRWYYSGGKLGRPDVEYVNLNVEDLEAAGAFSWTAETLAGVRFASAIFGPDGQFTKSGK